MAAVSLFRNTTMADVTSFKNVLLRYGERESRRYLYYFSFVNGRCHLQMAAIVYKRGNCVVDSLQIGHLH